MNASIDSYQSVYDRSINDPDGFWAEVAEDIVWDRRWRRVLDASRAPFYRWFEGGVLNTCHNALDVHLESGFGGRTALIYDSPEAGVQRRLTYHELLDRVARFAGALGGAGVGKGDRVIIYMPMIPETVIAMLACARIGAVHSVVFGGFAANELATRIDDARPRVIVSASCGLRGGRITAYKPLLDEAIRLAAHKPHRCILVQRPEGPAGLTTGRDRSWEDCMKEATPAGCVPVQATDPLYILYTSGTTGQPKGVVRDHGGHAVALKWSMKSIYDTDAGEVFWAASDVGWVVGHSYIVYGPLFRGCTTVLYEGKPVGTPDAGAFWRVIADHQVKTLFTSPTAFRIIRREDPRGEWIRRHDLSSLKALFLAGERCDPDTLLWAREMLDVPVIDHWWQTETGWPVAANCLGIEPMPVKPGSSAKPVPGFDVRVVSDDGSPASVGQTGQILIKLPLPPGTLPSLWRNEPRFRESYLESFPGYYLTGDAGHFDEDHYLWVMGRIDDVINVAGHRLSTGAMEEVVATHPAVAECAVIGARDEIKGQVPIGLVVLKSGVDTPHSTIIVEIRNRVRERIGAFASLKSVVILPRLPKTRSGKILRGVIRGIADRMPCKVPATIDDPGAIEEIREVFQKIEGANGKVEERRVGGTEPAPEGVASIS